jgi:hypothetical protein
MPISLTDKYKIKKKEFEKTGAFDVILDVDSRVFIDPALIESYNEFEFKDCKKKIEKYFSQIITLLKCSKKENDMFWKKADKLLKFKEIKGTCFGYSKSSTDGNAIGPIYRYSILQSITALIEAGELDPTIFEILSVFQEGIGCDRISDLITFILLPEILSYTQRILSLFNLDKADITNCGIKYKTTINEYNSKPIVLLPKTILSPLPVADEFFDIDYICSENERVRESINSYIDIGNRKKLSKKEIYNLMKTDSTFRAALINAYKSMIKRPYDFEEDPVGEYIWYFAAKEYVNDFPLKLNTPKTNNELLDVVNKICERFKDLIENNGLWSLLYDEKHEPKHERAAQLLFYGIADAYCVANDIDLSREPNSGNGPVDFKLSKGSKNIVVVEIKLTSNSQLKHGLEIQLPTYMKQENTDKAIYLVLDNGHPKALQSFIEFYNDQNKKVRDKIPYILVDATRKKSASVAG